MTWRTGITIFQIAKMIGQVLLDQGGGAGIGRPQASSAVAPHPHSSTIRLEVATPHHRDYSRHQHSNRGGTSAKFFVNPRFVTHKFRNYSTLYSSPPGSFDTTSMHARSQLSLIFH
jgi:hypothetical protein